MQKHRRVKSVVLKRFLEVVRLEPGFLADLCEKAGADLVAVMKRECVIGPPLAFEPAMRAGLPSDCPSDAEQRGQELPGFDRSPTAHATEKTFAKGAGTSSP